jgi:hypothetical protein
VESIIVKKNLCPVVEKIIKLLESLWEKKTACNFERVKLEMTMAGTKTNLWRASDL